ncbi:MAG: glycosyltransferase family 4 protein [Bacteriovoracaceae bacterium]
MKILLVTIEPPLPFSTAAAKWFYVLITELEKRGHEVVCFSTCSRVKDQEEARKIFPEEKLKLYSFPKKRNFLNRVGSILRPYSYMFSKEFLQDLSQECQKDYDIIHIEQLWAGWAIPDSVYDKSLINVHHLVTIDLEETKKTNFSAWYEYKQTVRAETILLKKFFHHRFFTSRISAKAHQLGKLPQGQKTVVPFSLDANLYPFKLPTLESKKIGMIASMGWYPGKSAALNLLQSVYPEVQREIPEVEVHLAGWNAKAELLSYVGQTGVHIFENIPQVESFFHSLSVFVYLPSRGSGMKIKVLEAMMYGIPVVTTEEGLEGLPAIHGIHAMIATNSSQAAKYTIELLNDKKKSQGISAMARALIESHCGKEKVVSEIEKIYKDIKG